MVNFHTQVGGIQLFKLQLQLLKQQHTVQSQVHSQLIRNFGLLVHKHKAVVRP